ncbi:MAG: ABC transporter ATP-binding protein [Clostridium sp.]|nr:ABC transporter ATP-binding protein [Clostridium sp.]
MLVKINNLCFKYKNSKKSNIRNFNLDVQKGEIVSILGESGSGKSTILRLIAGLEIPEDGQIIIDNNYVVSEEIFILPEKRGIGMVFQDYALFPHMTVAENVMFGLKKISKSEKDKRVKEMLDLVNLEGYERRYPHELRGGQHQRVAIARAVAPSPSVLLLDEPFSNLDAHLQNKIRSELKEIINRMGITSIFVTHDKEDAKSLADKVVILKDGEIIKYGYTEKILDS